MIGSAAAVGMVDVSFNGCQPALGQALWKDQGRGTLTARPALQKSDVKSEATFCGASRSAAAVDRHRNRFSNRE